MCDVCLDRSYIESNLIVICDLCEAAVHQNCYGSELLKEVPVGIINLLIILHITMNQVIGFVSVVKFFKQIILTIGR